MNQARFEWDAAKDLANQIKHGLAFSEAQYAFTDPRRVVARDITHSKGEERFYCFGRLDGRIATVRFTFRAGVIRIIGAGYWRKGRQIYEHENQLHR